jgi:hypothetical protein
LAKLIKIKIGDKFTLNCGVEVTVIEYINRKHILVQDIENGPKIVTDAVQLRRGAVNIVPFVIVGKEFLLNCGVKVTVSKYNNSSSIFINDIHGNSKEVCISALRKVNISWKQFGVPIATKTQLIFPIGSVWRSKDHGNFVICSAKDCSNIVIRWENTGCVQENCKSKAIKTGIIFDKTLDRDYLKPVKNRHYVYIVSHNNCIIYILVKVKICAILTHIVVHLII